jgi:ABC-type sugar transport system permease subunit
MSPPKEETMSPPLPAYQGYGPDQGLFARIKGMLPFHLWLMLPTIIVLAVITIYPFIWMIVMSFKETAMDPGEKDVWIGLYNYIRLLACLCKCSLGQALPYSSTMPNSKTSSLLYLLCP